ncbi:hypothetical protein Tcan_10039 [Toxocara canis]|uniref:Uncharacterized protein n=1 Tax=Toxocara canis TaxID=6265 RepID=A0A0B2W2D0_TOXCA|nr:hypothetical protein Tcan_10039 [Toxocara canis]
MKTPLVAPASSAGKSKQTCATRVTCKTLWDTRGDVAKDERSSMTVLGGHDSKMLTVQTDKKTLHCYTVLLPSSLVNGAVIDSTLCELPPSH